MTGKKSKETYKKYSNFIYDDTSNLHRAITWSNAYYGDSSSVVQLYKATEKPVMIQNPEIVKFGGVIASCGCVYREYFYFNPYASTAIFRLNLHTHVSECLMKGELTQYHVYGNMIVVDDVIYCSPRTSDFITAYNLKSNEVSFIQIDTSITKDNRCYDKYAKFMCSYYLNGRIYLIPYTYPAIISFCPRTQELEYHADCCQAYIDDCKLIFVAACVSGSKIIAAGERKEIIIFDTETSKFETIPIPTSCTGFSSVASIDAHIWFSSYSDGTIIKYDTIYKNCTEYSVFPEGIIFCDAMFCLSQIVGDDLWLFANNTNINVSVNLESGKIIEQRRFEADPGSYFQHNFIYEAEGSIYTSSWNDDGVIVYDTDNGGYSKVTFNVESDIGKNFFVGDFIDSVLNSKNMPFKWEYKYGIQNNLCNLLSVIQHQSECSVQAIENYQSAGIKIFEFTKDMLKV